MDILPKSMYRYNCNPYQNSDGIYDRNRTKILKFVWNPPTQTKKDLKYLKES